MQEREWIAEMEKVLEGMAENIARLYALDPNGPQLEEIRRTHHALTKKVEELKAIIDSDEEDWERARESRRPKSG